MQEGLEHSARIACGGAFADKEKMKMGATAAKEWLSSYLADAPFREPEEDLLKEDVSELEWLGVHTCQPL